MIINVRDLMLINECITSFQSDIKTYENLQLIYLKINIKKKKCIYI